MRRHSSAHIRLEMSPGSDIRDCIAEAVRISGVLGCGTRFDFNGVSVLADVDTDQERLYERVMEEMRGKHQFKIAAAWR